jgi:hypothetical protein
MSADGRDRRVKLEDGAGPGTAPLPTATAAIREQDVGSRSRSRSWLELSVHDLPRNRSRRSESTLNGQRMPARTTWFCRSRPGAEEGGSGAAGGRGLGQAFSIGDRPGSSGSRLRRRRGEIFDCRALWLLVTCGCHAEVERGLHGTEPGVAGERTWLDCEAWSLRLAGVGLAVGAGLGSRGGRPGALVEEAPLVSGPGGGPVVARVVSVRVWVGPGHVISGGGSFLEERERRRWACVRWRRA